MCREHWLAALSKLAQEKCGLVNWPSQHDRCWLGCYTTKQTNKTRHTCVPYIDSSLANWSEYSKTCVKRPLSKRPKTGFQDQLSFIEGQMYCRVLPLEHSAILSTFIKLPIVIKILILSNFEWLFYTGFTVLAKKVTFPTCLIYDEELCV